MRPFKRFTSLLLAAALSLSLAACASGGESSQSSQSQPSESSSSVSSSSSESSAPQSSAPAEKTPVRVAALKGPTGMSMAKLMADSEAKETENDYTFTLAGAPDEIVGKISTGELDIASVPTNLAATLYNKTSGGVQLLSVNALGVLYILDYSGKAQSVADLRGRTLYATGKGATPEYVLSYLLAQNGLDQEKDITVEYKSEHAELATLLIAGEVELAMLPEPFVTNVTGKLAEKQPNVIDLNAAWAESTGKELTMGGVIVRTDFAKEHPEAVAAFLREYKASVEYTVQNQAEAAKLIEQYDIMAAAVAEKAMPRCGLTFIDGEEMQRSMDAYLQVLFDTNPTSVGGKLPDAAFYYQP